jgi:hypothetical protein
MKRTSVVTSRKPRIISSIIFVLLFGSSAQAQNGDWQAVENLKPGTRLTVKARHNILCIFQSATDDELVCKPLRFLHLGPGESRFDRQSVREIRLEPNLGQTHVGRSRNRSWRGCYRWRDNWFAAARRKNNCVDSCRSSSR